MVLEKAELGLASRWGWVVTRGVLGVLFGLIAFSRPGAMAFSMVLIFGCYAFASGIATIIASARSGRTASWVSAAPIRFARRARSAGSLSMPLICVFWVSGVISAPGCSWLGPMLGIGAALTGRPR